MWPIYLYFGNQSKYDRAKPSSFAAHHLAYIPKLPDDFSDFYKQHYGKAPTEAVLTHMRREVIQAIWNLILDVDFMHAYEHGIVLKCGDGIVRRLFPPFFIYSANYPEKVLLASIRSLGTHPCPHCLVKKDQIDQLGTKWDRRQHETKAQNTFSDHFYKFGVNFYELFVPDVLHELELGVWKAILLHLIRMLVFLGYNEVQKMNERFRIVPAFGRDTIRKINKNVSALKRLAARDYEDFLQVSMPVFEDLFPDHNKEILDLLFTLNSFHSFSKLRLHSDISLNLLDGHTTELGKLLRAFHKLLMKYDTKELAKEVETRQRCKANRKKKVTAREKGKRKANDENDSEVTTVNSKLFNLCTYKIHALGHYVHFIRLFGTTDNYSTQIGELEHKRVKRFYARTNKTFKYVRQVTAHEHRTHIIHSLDQCLQEERQPPPARSSDPRVPFQHSDQMQPTEPDMHYKISNDKSQWVHIHELMNDNKNDPAFKSFYVKLKEYLFRHLSGIPDSDDITPEQRDTVRVKLDRIYKHKVLRVNYTSYDMRRCQDCINPRTRADIMVLSSDDVHPYWYARVIGIYHAMVEYNGGSPQQIDFLFVRWFVLDTDYKFGWKARRLPRVGFIDGNESCAFGFVDPSCVVRAVHLIPAFCLGQTSLIMGPSIARKESEGDMDWYRYYVGIFADRDMVVRFCPDLDLGHNRVVVHQQEDQPSNFLEDGDPDGDAIDPVDVPENPPDDENQGCDESGLLDDLSGDEWVDFGYGEEDEEETYPQDDEMDYDADIGPEDGEDPFNYDMDILDQEGYGIL
ncbi:hypothetical protein K435DRAFT_857796 [Dendrothele bispora CBS 962.96]|uniref:Uncharacterized protein n=1 Tax=Dendrothele bispora (strain CBS 962.96) TaxID=1314807 RepID=A0A4S8M4Z1_DENBC|nr:hypothetical protein K435DRAFT_857796 [Dendrothele bispora CBS 962.96]